MHILLHFDQPDYRTHVQHDCWRYWNYTFEGYHYYHTIHKETPMNLRWPIYNVIINIYKHKRTSEYELSLSAVPAVFFNNWLWSQSTCDYFKIMDMHSNGEINIVPDSLCYKVIVDDKEMYKLSNSFRFMLKWMVILYKLHWKQGIHSQLCCKLRQDQRMDHELKHRISKLIHALESFVKNVFAILKQEMKINYHNIGLLHYYQFVNKSSSQQLFELIQIRCGYIKWENSNYGTWQLSIIKLLQLFLKNNRDCEQIILGYVDLNADYSVTKVWTALQRRWWEYLLLSDDDDI